MKFNQNSDFNLTMVLLHFVRKKVSNEMQIFMTNKP